MWIYCGKRKNEQWSSYYISASYQSQDTNGELCYTCTFTKCEKKEKLYTVVDWLRPSMGFYIIMDMYSLHITTLEHMY